MAEHKINNKLVETPVEYLCGDPGKKTYSGGGQAEDVYGLKGPEGVSANGGIEFALIYENITPSAKADRPSDEKQFKGNSEV